MAERACSLPASHPVLASFFDSIPAPIGASARMRASSWKTPSLVAYEGARFCVIRVRDSVIRDPLFFSHGARTGKAQGKQPRYKKKPPLNTSDEEYGVFLKDPVGSGVGEVRTEKVFINGPSAQPRRSKYECTSYRRFLQFGILLRIFSGFGGISLSVLRPTRRSKYAQAYLLGGL